MHEDAAPPSGETPPPTEGGAPAPAPVAEPQSAPSPAPAPVQIVPKLTDTLMGGFPVVELPPPPAPLPAPVAPAKPPEPASITLLVVVTALSLAADLVTKGWAKATLAGFDRKLHGQRRFEVWKPHLGFIFAQNPGGAWSFLRSLPDTLRRPFFLVVSAGAIVFIVSIYQRVYKDQTAMKWGLPLALGGAMGNLVDRIRYGWVVDFIDISAKWGGREHHWPTFNVADIAIVVGVLLMAIDMGRMRRAPFGDLREPHEPPSGLGSASASAPPAA
jgi:signal peptidase II